MAQPNICFHTELHRPSQSNGFAFYSVDIIKLSENNYTVKASWGPNGRTSGFKQFTDLTLSEARLKARDVVDKKLGEAKGYSVVIEDDTSGWMPAPPPQEESTIARPAVITVPVISSPPNGQFLSTAFFT